VGSFNHQSFEARNKKRENAERKKVGDADGSTAWRTIVNETEIFVFAICRLDDDRTEREEKIADSPEAS